MPWKFFIGEPRIEIAAGCRLFSMNQYSATAILQRKVAGGETFSG